MYDDVESDFWKEIFVHLQHKNMVRVDAGRLDYKNCQAAFDRFALGHPEITPEITDASSYATWEIFITPSIKLRLFIQNQVKGTLLQKNGGELVRIADAKFPNDPFPEICEFLNNRDSYLKDLHVKLDESAHNQKKQKLIYEFIKANLIKKFDDDKTVVWNLEMGKQDFKLSLQKGKEYREILLNSTDYLKQLDSF